MLGCSLVGIGDKLRIGNVSIRAAAMAAWLVGHGMLCLE